MVLMIGLTGLRNVGKTTIADFLSAEMGFVRVHPFDGGKRAAYAYFRHCGADHDTATAMCWGDLKDQPSPYLPGSSAPRLFLEQFGRFMGQTMGVEWTLGAEIAAARRRDPGRPVVAESMVYEAAWFRQAGGIIVRVIRPGHEGPAGLQTDAFQAGIAADFELINEGNVADLHVATSQLLATIAGQSIGDV